MQGARENHMLEMELFCFDALTGPHFRLRGTIRPDTGGRLATYEADLLDHEGQHFAKGLLHRHPRWTEPLTGLTARCIDAALAGRDRSATFAYAHASLTVKLNGHHLGDDIRCVSEWKLARSGDDQASSVSNAALPHPWEVARLACASLAFGDLSIPPMPQPLQMPVYEHEGTRYCRTSDLPDEARALLERYAFGQHRPQVPGAPDAIFEWDMQHFLGAQ
jgi:hypothetical protein